MERIKEPFIHITKREPMPLWKSLCIRFGAVLIALIICAIFISASAPNSKGFFGYFGSLFSGAFGTERRFWLLLQQTGLLLCVALALVVAFRMKFWNLGGNGQVLMGCLACAMCMYYLGGKTADPLVWLLMLIASIAAGAIWAVIPAIFKAFFNTNESLFTLMMNYVALYLVAFFVSHWYPEGTGAMPPLTDANLPSLGSGQAGRSLLTVIVAIVVTALIYCYLRFTKHGYEISLIGDSKNTARYAGISVKKVIIRTLILSGALCGLVGFLLVGSINHMVSTSMDGNMGFTGIMVAWMGKFNPLIMAGISFFINFLSRGMAQVCTDFGFTSEALSDIVVGLIYFFFIGCEFFIIYKVHFNFKKHHGREEPAFSMDASSEDSASEQTGAEREETEKSALADGMEAGKSESTKMQQPKETEQIQQSELETDAPENTDGAAVKAGEGKITSRKKNARKAKEEN